MSGTGRPAGAYAVDAFLVFLDLLKGQAEQFAQPLLTHADQHPANLRRAGADLVQFRIAPQPPGRVFVDVPVAAQELYRIQSRLGRRFGAK